MDASAWLACRELSQVNRDAAAGVLSDTELRAGMRRVYDRAKTNPESEVAKASAALLRTLTTGANPGEQEITALVEACRGYEARRTN